MKNKLTAVFMIVLMCVSAMGAFANGAQEAKEEPQVVNILFTGADQIQEKEYLQNSFLADFTAETGIQVKIDFINQNDAVSKVKSEQETKNYVSDIIFTDTAHVAPYLSNNWVADITAAVDATDSTITNMFDPMTNIDGKRYFAPVSYDVYVLIANAKALEYLPEGLTREDVENGLSWDQFADWGIEIKKATGMGKVMFPAAKTGSQLLYPMGGMSMAFGGAFPEFESEGFKEALAVLARIAEADAFYAEQNQYSAVTDPMTKGDAWLAFSHMAPANAAYITSPNSFVVGAAPHGDVAVGSTAGAWCVGILANAPNNAAAEAFLQYFIDPENDYDYCYNFGSLSPIAETRTHMTDEDVIMKTGAAILDNAVVSGVPANLYVDWNAVKLLYCDIFEEVLNGKAVPSDAFLAEKAAALHALEK